MISNLRRSSLGALVGGEEEKKDPQRTGCIKRVSELDEAMKEGKGFGVPK